MRNRVFRRYLIRIRRAWRRPTYRAIALLALIIVAIAAGFPNWPQGQGERQTAGKTQEQQPDSIPSWVRWMTTKTADDPIALFTLVLTLSTVGLWIVTWRSGIEQGMLTRRALAESRRSANIAERAFIADERAWLKIEVLTEYAALSFDGGARYSVGLWLRNIGRTPALNIECSVWLLAQEPDSDIRIKHKALCDDMKTRGGILRWSLFHDYVIPSYTHAPMAFGLNIPGIELAKRVHIFNNEPVVVLYIGACVDYGFPASPTGHHQTSVLYELIVDNSPIIQLDRGPVDPSRITLREPTIMRARHAD
jgi:hypothetical protein